VFALYTNHEKSDTIFIEWSPAYRLNETDAEQPVRLYEGASDFGSGLMIFDPATLTPKVLKISTSKVDCNVAIQDIEDEVHFGSANSVGQTMKIPHTRHLSILQTFILSTDSPT
jgi:hypothetical protein